VNLAVFKQIFEAVGVVVLTGSCLVSCELEVMEEGSWLHQPTLELASVKLFNVVLLPLDGLPTNPIKGSRGMVER
jgi:hypothetical protein